MNKLEQAEFRKAALEAAMCHAHSEHGPVSRNLQNAEVYFQWLIAGTIPETNKQVQARGPRVIEVGNLSKKDAQEVVDGVVKNFPIKPRRKT